MNQALQEITGDAFGSLRIERDDSSAKLEFAIDRAQRSLIEQQHAEGYWHAALEANAQMNAEYIIFMHFMEAVDKELEQRLKKVLLDAQNADGSWSLFPGGEGYLSTSIEAYFALKLSGLRAGDEPMMQARRWILSKGGIEKCGTLARFYLACMGQMPWDSTASLPVEIALFPNWFFFNMYQLASWARGTAFGLMLLQVAKPTVPVDYRDGVLELYIQPPHFTKFRQPPPPKFLSLRTLFNFTDSILRVYDRHHIKSLRARALRYAENWILDHQEANGSFGGIQPCYLLSTMALKALGYRNEHPVVRKGLDASRELIWEMGDRALYMPCVSPNWDTALAAKALLDSGLSTDHPRIAAIGAMAYRSSDLQKGRLVGEAARPRAGRMGLRVLQRQLSRRGRFGGDPRSPRAHRRRQRGRARSARFAPAPTGRWACNRATEVSPPSMPIARRSGSIRFRSPMSRRLSIPRAPT